MTKKNIHISFFYFDKDHSEEFKNIRKYYLNKLKENIHDKLKLQKTTLINFHEVGGFSDGFVSIFDRSNSYEKIYSTVDYILSRGDSYLPVVMLGHNKTEFSMIESILKNHYGDHVKLNYGWFGIGKLFGHAGFKVKKSS